VDPKLSHHKHGLSSSLTPSSLRIDCTQAISAVAFAMVLYSDSVLDLETVGCFFALQAIKLGPKNIANPLVDSLSSTQPAQSASEKALIILDFDLLNARPVLIVPFTNLRILLTAVQCSVVGACRY
jgi:predicted RNA methylase